MIKVINLETILVHEMQYVDALGYTMLARRESMEGTWAIQQLDGYGNLNWYVADPKTALELETAIQNL